VTNAAAQGNAGNASGSCSTTPKSSEISQIASIPDYGQNDTAYGGFVSGNYCGPTAVSNSYMWLSDHGFPNLALRSDDRKKDQHDLIAALGSPSYFDTNAVFDGTPPSSLLPGLKRYLVDKGYTHRRLEWQGWSPIAVPAEFDTRIQVPELAWLKLGIERTGGVWLLLAYGRYDSANDRCRITNGHWVTLVGHGWDGAQQDPDCLVVHDPWTGGSLTHEYLRTRKLASGQFSVEVSGLPNYTASAAGYYETRGLPWASSYDMWLIGAIVLEMPGDCS